MSQSTNPQHTRRDFLKVTGAVAASAAVMGAPYIVRGQESKKALKVAIVGCGGRGSEALANHMDAVKFLNEKHNVGLSVQVVAAADWSKGRAEGTAKKYGLDAAKCFGGPDAYRKAIDAGPDLVIMGQPPAFRPVHFEYAIKAGKHVFFEKPCAVDPQGIRRVIAAGEEAAKKNLCVVAGTQRRHDKGYNQRYLEIKDGAYGKVMAARVAWNQGKIFTNTPVNPTKPDQLAQGWHIWVEMSGDHIVEQHVHNLDIANWYIGSHPVAATGMGLRARRIAGNMYDFFSVDLEYPDGVYCHSMCRQIEGCADWIGEQFTMEKRSKAKDWQAQTTDPWAEVGYHGDAYVSEHAHLLWSILTGKPVNEAKNVAWATGAAIIGRESAYSGQRIMWKDMFEQPNEKDPKWFNLRMKPSAEDFETGEVVMLKDGDIRVPGKA